MTARYVQHVHEYHHESTCVDHVIIYAWFAWLPDSMNADELDDAETRTIIWAESQGWELHNKLKTNRPQGEGTVIIQLHDEAGLEFCLESRGTHNQRTSHRHASRSDRKPATTL